MLEMIKARRKENERFWDRVAETEKVFRELNESIRRDEERQLKWDRRYQDLARYVSLWSKDPSTQSGAVIVGDDNQVVSVGYNGFARGVDDSPERYADRELKYKMVVHCEVNTVLSAGRPVRGCTLYTWPFACCSRCAAIMTQAGITRVVSPPLPDGLRERWGADIELSARMFEEAGVELRITDFASLPEVAVGG